MSVVRSLLAALAVLVLLAPVASAQDTPPTTTFEDNGGSDWTPRADEEAFLQTLGTQDRVELTELGKTDAGTSMFLLNLGMPAPHSVEAAQDLPVEFHFCTQHGNEPAGREGCLRAARDLAYTDDPVLLEQMKNQVTLFVTTANPDGREANTRENSNGVDLNRQHLEVDETEVRILGRIIRDWKPAIAVDHHEYSGIPLTYDDDLTILWPRNKNVHVPLRDMAVSYTVDFMKPCVLDKGYTMDEYGVQSVSTPAMDIDLAQTAGDHDDGISRNVGGLRHGIGILIESYVDLVSTPLGTTMQRRVDSHVATIECTLDWMRANGQAVYDMSRESRAAKVLEGQNRSAPTFFDGQDEDTTAEALVVGSRAETTSLQDPPFCGFTLTAEQLSDVDVPIAFEVHGITSQTQADGSTFVSMAQEAEPIIGLLLDERGSRNLVDATGLDDCSAFAAAPTPVTSPTPAPASPTPAPAPSPSATAAPAPTSAPSSPLPVTGGGLALAGLATALLATRRRR